MENARRKRRTISIDDRVAAAKAKVEKIKFRYDRAIAELRKVMDERDECRKRELLDPIGKSKRTYEESRNWRAPQQQACLLIWSSFKACTKCKY